MNLRRLVARRDQRGVVLLLAVPGLVMAVAAMALSIDIGRQVLERRSNQKIADLASLDAARDLPNAQAAAEASAARNGLDLGEAGTTLLAERGTLDANRVFTLDPAGDDVRVTVSSVVDYIFMPGSKAVTAKGVSRLPSTPPPTPPTTPPSTPPTTAPVVPTAGFDIGSTLASIDTTKAPLLNAVLGRWLRGAAAGGGNADVVGWQGLLTSSVTLEVLRNHLELLDAGVQFGTVDQMLDADITLAELAQATAGALTAGGDSNASLYAGPAGIIAQATSTATFKLGQLIEVAAGSEDAALGTEFNAWGLLTGSAMVANGTNLVSVPDIGIALPAGLGTVSLSLKVIEGKKTYIGPAGGTVSTSQVEMTITPVLDRPLTVAGLVGARLTGSFPMAVTAAGATGTLSAIDCEAPGAGIDVGVDLKPFGTSTSTTLGVSAVVLGSTVPLFSAETTGGVALTDPGPDTLAFAHPGDFTPTATGQRVGASPIDLQALSTYDVTISTLGLTPVPAGLAAAIVGDLELVAGLLDTNVMTALHRTLGVSVGAADVSALKGAYDTGCAAPAPPPPTTTTTTSTTLPSSTVPPQPELVG
ncbi:MAG: pilus assembly protein TadG-related protein [Acidimicrobiales bacterium]